MTTGKPIFMIKDVSVRLHERGDLLPVVSSASIEVSKGGCTGIIGESGCGKSVLCRAVLGLLESPKWQVEGEVLLEGERVPIWEDEKMDLFRGSRMTMIVQNPLSAFDPRLTIGAHFLEGCSRKEHRKSREKVLRQLERMYIHDPETVLKSYPFQLSGGMLQRVLIALCLQKEPGLLVADEPTTSLDSTVQKEILKLLKELQQKRDISLLLVSHDLEVISRMADTVYVMYAGRVVEQGDMEEVRKKAASSIYAGIVQGQALFFKGTSGGYGGQTSAAGRNTQSRLSIFVKMPRGSGNMPGEAVAASESATGTLGKMLEPGRNGIIMEDFLKVYSVSKSYRHGKRKVQNAVSGVSFTLEEGRCLGLVGESGCGKSTLCRLIAGVEQPSGGEILYQGESNYLKKLRGQIQMVFQNSLDAVNLHLNVFRIIEEPLENFSKLKRQERRERVGELLETVGLSKEDMDKYPQQFSGGQLQRICIARALAANPKLLLLDEPLSSLDVSVQAQLLNLLSDLKKDWNLTCILVSHDLEAVYYLADEIVVMYGGCLVEQIRDIGIFLR